MHHSSALNGSIKCFDMCLIMRGAACAWVKGLSVSLYCRKLQVGWLRERDNHVLSMDTTIFTGDDRFQVERGEVKQSNYNHK